RVTGRISARPLAHRHLHPASSASARRLPAGTGVHFPPRLAMGVTTGRGSACHLLRHTMATVMLEHGADIRVIQEILGHARLTTTQLYTRASIRLLKAVHTATHPAATLRRPVAPQTSVAGTGPLEGPAASLFAANDTAPPYTHRHGDRAESGA